MTKHTRPPKPAPPAPPKAGSPRPLDPERQALALRAARAARCEQEIGALLAKHSCALQAVQTWVNGQPQPIVIRVVPLEQPPPQDGT